MVRPTIRTPEVEERVLAWFRAGRSLRDMDRDPDMPGHSALYRWRDADPEFDTKVRVARQIGWEGVLEECVLIADGDPVHSSGDVQRDKLRIDTRMKVAALIDPGRWGARQAVTHEGKLDLEAVVKASLKIDPRLEEFL